jgi:hypothetical protein
MFPKLGDPQVTMGFWSDLDDINPQVPPPNGTSGTMRTRQSMALIKGYQDAWRFAPRLKVKVLVGHQVK